MRFAATHGDSRDVPALFDLLGALHEAANRDEVSTRLVRGLRDLARCDLVSYNDIDVENPGTRTWFEPELVPRPELEAAFDALQYQHPLVRDYAATGDPSPRRMSDFVTLPQLQGLGLWHEVFRPLETNYQIAFAVLASRTRVTRARGSSASASIAGHTISTTANSPRSPYCNAMSRLPTTTPGCARP